MNLLRTKRPLERLSSHISFWYVYLIAVVFNFHSTLVSYTTPTYLSNFIDQAHVGLLYSFSAVGSLILFIFLPNILRIFGNVTTTIVLMLSSIIALVLVGGAFNIPFLIIGFILFQMINPLIYLNIDIFSETLIGHNESGTGTKRGLILSLMSLVSVLAPITISYVVGNESTNLDKLYYIAIGIGAVYIFIIISLFRRFFDAVYERTRIIPLLKKCFEIKPIRVVLVAHFILQVFFTWTVIYIPLYLAKIINLPWSQIGSIIAVGAVAYVVCEYPIGIIADKYIGEKEMMALGFFILSLAVATIAFMPVTASISAWMGLMFFSRTGASLVEVTTESYFFKNVTGEDANLISIFRLTRPLSVLFGSLLGTICLIYLPFNLAFVVLAFVMAIGIFVTLAIDDTK